MLRGVLRRVREEGLNESPSKKEGKFQSEP